MFFCGEKVRMFCTKFSQKRAKPERFFSTNSRIWSENLVQMLQSNVFRFCGMKDLYYGFRRSGQNLYWKVQQDLYYQAVLLVSQFVLRGGQIVLKGVCFVATKPIKKFQAKQPQETCQRKQSDSDKAKREICRTAGCPPRPPRSTKIQQSTKTTASQARSTIPSAARSVSTSASTR